MRSEKWSVVQYIWVEYTRYSPKLCPLDLVQEESHLLSKQELCHLVIKTLLAQHQL